MSQSYFNFGGLFGALVRSVHHKGSTNKLLPLATTTELSRRVSENRKFPREASTPIFKIRSCAGRKGLPALTGLSGPTARPPPRYRTIGYSYTYRTYVFQVPQGIALYPPPPPKLPHRSREKGCRRGYRSSSCPLEGIALYGGIAEIVSPIAV